MNEIIELLKPEDISSYKTLIDECFGSRNSIEKYQQYQANNSYKIYVIKDNNIIVGSVTQYAIELFTFGFQPYLMLQ